MSGDNGQKIAYGVFCQECDSDRKAVQFNYKGVYYLVYQCPNCLSCGFSFAPSINNKWDNTPEVSATTIPDEIKTAIERNIRDRQRVLRA